MEVILPNHSRTLSGVLVCSAETSIKIAAKPHMKNKIQ
jgi:hypothetical protein